MGFFGGSGNSGSAQAVVSPGLSSQLVDLLLEGEIEPGSSPGYQLCKTIYAYHPLGAKLADAPITMAQSQDRLIDLPVAGEEVLVEAFDREWDALSGVGASVVIHNTVKTSRIYGIAALAVGERGVDPAEPLDMDKLASADIYFNVMDPLNTAGSLVLNQDPNSPDFLKPSHIRVAGRAYHPSRTCVLMNEQPVYIEWSTSAFGFVGRSVYQRALYPLRTFVQSMITDQMVTQKAGLLIAKMKAPGNIINNVMQSMAGMKATQLKAGSTGQVLTIGHEDGIESLNFQNLEPAARFARDNMLKNIATAAGMPAAMVNNETLTAGFGEGTEDAKQIARYIDHIRVEMAPIYRFMDRLVQRRAWTPEFFASMQRLYPDHYGRMDYNTAFYVWRTKFRAQWPNLLVEPDSEILKGEDIVAKSAIAAFEVLAPALDPENKAEAAVWLANVLNNRKKMFGGETLNLDPDKIASYQPPEPLHEPRPEVESSHE